MLESPIPSTLPNWPKISARDLLHRDVERELEAYRQRQEPDGLVLLDVASLTDACRQGAVRFGKRDLPVPEIDTELARRTAAEAVADGIVLMFINETAIHDLDQIHAVNSDSHVRYLRIHAQSGL